MTSFPPSASIAKAPPFPPSAATPQPAGDAAPMSLPSDALRIALSCAFECAAIGILLRCICSLSVSLEACPRKGVGEWRGVGTEGPARGGASGGSAYTRCTTPRKGVLNVPSCAPSTLLSDALEVAASQQPKRRKGEAGSLLGETAHAQPFCLQNITLEIPVGARVLLVGSNGAGKSTLLALMGGQMVSSSLSLSLDVLFLAAHSPPRSHIEWLLRVVAASFASLSGLFLRVSEDLGALFAYACMQMTQTGELLIFGRRAFDDSSLANEVDPAWRMGFVSAGERRRAQLVASLAERRRVYLLDEPTGELDVVSREMLCRFLLAESRAVGSCVVYSTHVFDGLCGWATHILYLRKGAVCAFSPVAAMPE
ncbi:ABC transporter domain-containing protein C20G4.01 [Cyclospora cayetanensis]|uniref:ABC transporter domain-containing protein C20G4.01 n=1 Tax=Cyclospora cayetanensis TaxID=88456 RepID=A0A6P6S192_9EIME|nr:ABC transporter domain-containing protein C20G4.01 [Cyclospora cayetanensis]